MSYDIKKVKCHELLKVDVRLSRIRDLMVTFLKNNKDLFFHENFAIREQVRLLRGYFVALIQCPFDADPIWDDCSYVLAPYQTFCELAPGVRLVRLFAIAVAQR